MKKQIPSLVPNNVWGKDHTVKDLTLKEATFVKESMTINDAMNLFKSEGKSEFPCKNDEGKIIGVLTTTMLMSKLNKMKVTLSDTIKNCMVQMKNVRLMSSGMPVFELSRVLERENFVIVDDKFVVTSQDVLDFM